MKKGILVFIGVVVLLGAFFILSTKKLKRSIDAAYKEIEVVDMKKLKDGVYEGQFKQFPMDIVVKVTMKSGTLVNLNVQSMKSGPGYTAAETLPRILDKQQPKVDAVSGATGTSKGIMIATYRALQKAK